MLEELMIYFTFILSCKHEINEILLWVDCLEIRFREFFLTKIKTLLYFNLIVKISILLKNSQTLIFLEINHGTIVKELKVIKLLNYENNTGNMIYLEISYITYYLSQYLLLTQ